MNMNSGFHQNKENIAMTSNYNSGSMVKTEDPAHLKLVKKFRSILNKITWRNFDRLFENVTQLPVRNENDLDALMHLVYKRAVREPGFSRVYACLCQKLGLQDIRVTCDQMPYESLSFTSHLLSHCKKEFEAAHSHKNDEAMAALLNRCNTFSLHEQPKLCSESETLKTKTRRYRLGVMRFVGELYNLNMLEQKLMHEHIKLLLNSDNEEDLELLCTLMTTIGKELETEQNRSDMDTYFTEIHRIAYGYTARTVSTRIKFLLRDVIELRERGWTPRRMNREAVKLSERVLHQSNLEKPSM